MDIYNYLKKDHKKVSDLFEKIVASPLSNQNEEILENIITELTLHADTEKVTFYKAIKNNNTEKDKEEIKHATEEHDEIKAAMQKMSKLSFGSPSWFIQLGELKSIVEHHVHEEETEIFERAKKILSSQQAQNLAKEMDELKEKMMEKLSIS